MEELIKIITKATHRGACICGRCIEHPTPLPTGHLVEMVFFKVGFTDKICTKEEFINATRQNVTNASDNPLNGDPHNYQVLGGWIGDQGLALRYMALGTKLEVFELLTPCSLNDYAADNPLAQEEARAGLILVRAREPVAAVPTGRPDLHA